MGESKHNTHLLVIAYYVYVLCNTVIFSSLVHHVRPDDGLIEKGPKHVVYLLTPYTVIKCCVLTHPPDIILIFDIVHLQALTGYLHRKKPVYVYFPFFVC